MKERDNMLMRDSKFERLIAGLCLILFCWTVPAFGAHPLVSDDTGTQGKGKAQIEITGQYDEDDEEGLRTEIWEAKAALTLGLFDPLDLILEAPYDWISTKNDKSIRQDGFADLFIALKWRFFEQGGWSFAVKPAVTLPTGKEEKCLGNGRASYGIGLITTHASDPWAFHLNLGVTHSDYKLDADKEACRKDTWNASLAAEYKCSESMKFVADIGAERNPDVTSVTPPAFILGGLIYSLSEGVDVDAGIKWGLSDPEPDISFLAGMTFRF